MPFSPLAELRGERRFAVRLNADLSSDLHPDAEVVVGADPFGAGLQVLIADWARPGAPSIGVLRRLHAWRLARKAFPLVVVIRQEDSDGFQPGSWTDPDDASSLRDAAASDVHAGQYADAPPGLLTDRGDVPPVAQTWLGHRRSRGARADTSVWVLGPNADTPATLSERQVVRMLRATLEESAGTAARRRITGLLGSAGSESDCPGLTNSGLFSSHYLFRTLPQEQRWEEARKRARPLLEMRGHTLIRGLGFKIQDRLAHALVLAAERDEQRAVAVLLDRNETFEAESARLGQSPAGYGLAKARQRNADWLILMRGDQLRLYSAEAGVGVGSRSRVETWLGLDLAALDDEGTAYLDLVFSAAALAREGTVADLLDKSRQFATDLGSRLRQRIYEHVVPRLAVGVADALDRQTGPDASRNLGYAYRLSLRILFRLLFQAYAEDRGLLPYGRNRRFDRHSLKNLAMTLAEDEKRRRQPESVAPEAEGSAFDAAATTFWTDLRTVWRAIDKGDRGMNVPAYNGGLFDTDPTYRQEGADLEAMELTDDAVGPALRDLLVDQTPDGEIGPVDFRSLSVREFGTIYEGLLESELSCAEVDLTVDRKNAYRPAGSRDKVVVQAGEVYFHNRSGERKATGSYFTPEFAVEHLLERSLEPVIDDHLAKVERLLDESDEAAATEKFWDFRVADIAMGSGHFLVAALDRIEARMQDFLTRKPLRDVSAELVRLEQKARASLGDASVEIERATLLRRQIARRCIYGVDVNEIAVELARVAVWIHTFVPGLPISTLDHNLVCADSLTGIGTLEEALDVLDPDRGERQMSIYSAPILEAMRSAVEPLAEQANALEADLSEVERGREQLREAKAKAEPARLLFDAAVAVRLELADVPGSRSVEDLAAIARRPKVAAELDRMKPAHMPALFPEVFTRDRPGFDVLIGNPPWEEARIEEQEFWALRFPGYQGLAPAPRAERLRELKEGRPDLVGEYSNLVKAAKSVRKLLLAGPYPGMGVSDPDLYKAFCWRFWQLSRGDGASGVVLPRSALAEKGLSRWRNAVLDGGAFSDVTLLQNRRHWAFNIHAQYSIALVAIRKGLGDQGLLRLRGPYDSRASYYRGLEKSPTEVSVEEFLTWTTTAGIPAIPGDEALRVFRRMRRHPRLDLRLAAESASSTEVAASSEQRAASSEQRAASSEQRAASSEQRAASSEQRSSGNAHSSSGRTGTEAANQQCPSAAITSTSSPDVAGTANDRRALSEGEGAVPAEPARHWRARPYREVDGGKDRGFFEMRSSDGTWRVFGGRSFNIWTPDTGNYKAWTNPADALAFLQRKRLNGNKNRRSAFSEFPRAWAENDDTQPWFAARIAYRNVTRATDTRTVIAALVPAEVVLVDKAPYLLWPKGDLRDQAYLLGVLCSMPLDWFARRIVELSLTYNIFNSLPIPRPELNDPSPSSPGIRLRDRIIEVAGRLATAEPDHPGFREWAAVVGVEPGSIDSEEKKQDLIAELDAVVAHLYGLSEDDLAVIYDTFHTGADYSERHAQVLQHFRDWRQRVERRDEDGG